MSDKDKLIYDLTSYIEYVDVHVDQSSEYVKYDKHLIKLLTSLTSIMDEHREIINNVVKDQWRKVHIHE